MVNRHRQACGDKIWRVGKHCLEFVATPRSVLAADLSIPEIPRPKIMGIVNVTPDSFSDGGRYVDPGFAVEHALKLQADGAGILDIGGESTRPYAEPVSEREELARVIPVIERLASRTDAIISVDTSKALVAREAVSAGAHIINDVTGLAGDPGHVRCRLGLRSRSLRNAYAGNGANHAGCPAVCGRGRRDQCLPVSAISQPG